MCRAVVRTTTGAMGASGGAGSVVTGNGLLTNSPVAVRIVNLNTYVVFGVNGILFTARIEHKCTRAPDRIVTNESLPAFLPVNVNPSVRPYLGSRGGPHRSSMAPAVMAPVMGGSAVASNVCIGIPATLYGPHNVLVPSLFIPPRLFFKREGVDVNVTIARTRNSTRGQFDGKPCIIKRCKRSGAMSNVLGIGENPRELYF